MENSFKIIKDITLLVLKILYAMCFVCLIVAVIFWDYEMIIAVSVMGLFFSSIIKLVNDF